MTLAEYIIKRNGVPIGHANSLRNNLYRSVGAKNFSTFWNYWNPIFGYYLGKKIFKPLKRYLSPAFAFIITFLLCGMIHDAVTSIFRGEVSFFFSVWFLLMSIAVLISRYFKQDLAGRPWIIKAISNLSIIGFCFFLTACIAILWRDFVL